MKTRTIKRIVRKAAEPSDTIVAHAKVLAQASVLRLELEKKEAAAKEAINRLMKRDKIPFLAGNFSLGGTKVNYEVSMEKSTSTAIDIEKLTKMLTPSQFKQCATVTLKAAKEVLPQALVDKCSFTKTRPAVAKIKFSKGYPVPEVKLLH